MASTATKLDKIETFFNDQAYKEILESSETYNSRLCIERRLRMPFLDPQTGTAQNHSALFKSKRQRIPGLREGQLYSYPSARWRKSRRQYLQRTYYRPREPELMDGGGDYSNHGGGSGHGGGDSMGLPGGMDMDSKDSHSLVHVKDEMSNNPWYYDELDAMEDDFDDAGPDSDMDFEESYGGKKRGPKKGRGGGGGAGEGSSRKSKLTASERTGSDTPSKKSTGSRRGRKSKLNLDGDRSSSPMAYSSKKSRHSMQIHDDHSNSSFIANLDNPATPHAPSHSSSSSQHQMIAPRPELFGNTMEPQQTPLIPVAVTNSSAPVTASASGGPGAVPSVAGPIPDAGPGGPPAPAATAANPAAEKDHSRRGGEKGKLAARSPYCDFCLGDTRENKKTGTAEELVSCSDCGRSGHPSCLQFTANMMISVKRYRWQCIECKYCSICGTSDNDDQLLFCDDCDRGYHMYCLSPALTAPPEGSWSCKLCVVEFHTPKPKGMPSGGPPGIAGAPPVISGGPPGAQMPPGGGPVTGGGPPGMPPSAIAQQLQQQPLPPGGPQPPPGMHGYPPGMPPHMGGMMHHPGGPPGHPQGPYPPMTGHPQGPMSGHPGQMPGGPPPPGHLQGPPPPGHHQGPPPGGHPGGPPPPQSQPMPPTGNANP